MQISWLGLSCFELKTKTLTGEVRVVTDPYDNTTGLRFPRTLEADIVTVSHNEDDANNVAAVQGEPFLINSPGEYEVKGVFVNAILAKGKDKDPNTILTHFEIDRIRVAHLGALNRELTNEEVDQLGDVDLLMLPVGGGRVLSPEMAAKVVGQVDPRMILPMTYALDSLKEPLKDVDAFCRELSSCAREDAPKLKIARKDLPADRQVIVVLSR